MTAQAVRARLAPVGGLDTEVFPLLLGLGAALVAAAAAVLAGPVALAIPVAIAGVIFLVREPLALLTLYVYIGLFKEEAIVQAIPVDATAGLGALLALVCFARLVSHRARPVPYLLALALAVVGISLVVSLGWTPAPEYGGEKAAKFLTLTMLAALAPFFLIRDETDLRRLGRWLVILAIAAAAMALVHPPASAAETGRLELGPGGSTIGVSRLLCAAAIVLLLMALGNTRARPLSAGVGLVLIGVAAAVGSRGPILSLVLALAATAAVWLMRSPRKVWPVVLVAALGIAVAPFVSLPESSSRRLSAVASDPVAAFARDDRSTLYRQAVELVDSDMLRGAGAGAFASINRAKYPHNIFLELWAELGILAVTVVAAAIIAALAGLNRAAWRLPEGDARQIVYIVTGVFLFYLFAVQVSGDLNDNREFWVALSVAWVVVRYGVPPPQDARA